MSRCPYCNEEFSIQGLAGHIQFKHASELAQERKKHASERENFKNELAREHKKHASERENFKNELARERNKHASEREKDKNHSLLDLTIAGGVIFVAIKYGKTIFYELLKSLSGVR